MIIPIFALVTMASSAVADTTSFFNLNPNKISNIGLDLGITSTKICYKLIDDDKIYREKVESGEKFIENFEKLFSGLGRKNDDDLDLKIGITGVGATKYRSRINNFSVKIELDELSALGKSLQANENLHLSKSSSHLIVNAGTGCSIAVLDRNGTTTRIGGSALAGGTFEALAALAFRANGEFFGDSKSFWNKVVEILEKRSQSSTSSHNLHKTIGQVLGTDQEIYGLKPDIIAAFLSNINHQNINDISIPDLIIELQTTITFNLISLVHQMIGKLACQTSQTGQLVPGQSKIVYTGGYFTLPNSGLLIGQISDFYGIGYERVFVDNEFSGAEGCLRETF